MEQENRQYLSMRAAARERLSGRDPEDIARRSGAVYVDGALQLRTFGKQVCIAPPGFSPAPELAMWHELTVLHYLDLADGAPLTGQTMSFSQYPDGGLVRGGGFDRDAEALIGAQLGALSPQTLAARCRALGAELLESNADFCARFAFLPRYPMLLKLWFADEEFPASGRLLLDTSAPHYLSIEDAVTAGSLLLDLLSGQTQWTNYA